MIDRNWNTIFCKAFVLVMLTLIDCIGIMWPLIIIELISTTLIVPFSNSAWLVTFTLRVSSLEVFGTAVASRSLLLYLLHIHIGELLELGFDLLEFLLNVGVGGVEAIWLVAYFNLVWYVLCFDGFILNFTSIIKLIQIIPRCFNLFSSCIFVIILVLWDKFE